MPRSVYFSFHYQDVIDFRANVVRNSGKFRNRGDVFRDSSIWEEAEEKRVKTIKKLIDNELTGTSVTCVLIGDETYSRRWVRYEIAKSFENKKGQVGVGINWIKGRDGGIKILPGNNPFDYLSLSVSKDGKSINFFERKNGRWIEYKDLPSIKNLHFKEERFGSTYTLSELYERYSYDWNNGKLNFNSWIEEAASKVGR